MTAQCASSGTCVFVNTPAAAIIGLISAFIYDGVVKLMAKLEIDDPMNYT